MTEAPGAVNADERAAAAVPSVVVTAHQAEQEAERLALETEQEYQKEKTLRKEHEDALAADQGVFLRTLTHKLVLLGKTLSSARDSRGVVHEMWSYLLPRQEWWFLIDVSPGLIFSGATLVVEGLQLAGSQPIPADVIQDIDQKRCCSKSRTSRGYGPSDG